MSNQSYQSNKSVPLIKRHRTAISRRDLSRPLRLAIDHGLLTLPNTVLDYGCGRGDDLHNLRTLGFRCDGWDPMHNPNGSRSPSDVVNLGYVVNVIENADERRRALEKAWSLTRKLLVVSSQLDFQFRKPNATTYGDGVLTNRATFQKYFEQGELRGWIDSVLGQHSLPAAPGVFYVFRDERLRETFFSSRYRRLISVPGLPLGTALFETHKALLEPLVRFLTSKGRFDLLPENSANLK